jgi:hypothetical protein
VNSSPRPVGAATIHAAMQSWLLILNIPLGVVLTAGFLISVWNFYRHGKAARLALAGFAVLLLWYWSWMPVLILSYLPLTNPTATAQIINRLIPITVVLEFVIPIGLALLTWAVLAGRGKQKEGTH